MALFRSPSDRKQIGIIAEHMFDKNRQRFMSAYYQETDKPYGYLSMIKLVNASNDLLPVANNDIKFGDQSIFDLNLQKHGRNNLLI